jgi:hypothetical protein
MRCVEYRKVGSWLYLLVLACFCFALFVRETIKEDAKRVFRILLPAGGERRYRPYGGRPKIG